MCVLFKLPARVVDTDMKTFILLFPTDAHNYKIIGILKQVKFRLSLRHVSVHAGTIFRELSRAWLKLRMILCARLY